MLGLLLSGCDDEKPQPTPQPGASVPTEKVEESLYKNFAGQIVTRIKVDELDKWLMLNRNFEIVTMTSESIVTSSGNDANPTTHFIIVYKIH